MSVAWNERLASFAPARLLLIRLVVVFVIKFLLRLDVSFPEPGIELDSLVVVTIQVKYIHAIFEGTFRQVFSSNPF